MKKNFTGTWEDRLYGLTDCGVDFAGKTVLDLGCNMGVIAYEIAKMSPAFIHGLDRSEAHVSVARSIFAASAVESKFDVADVGDASFLSLLRSSYDVVLMLAVYHHLPLSVRPVLHEIMKRCRETFIFRDPGTTEGEIISAGADNSLLPAYRSQKPRNAGPLTVLLRTY